MRQPFVHEMFQQAAAQHGARTAIATGDRQMTYAELDAWSNNIAAHLLGLGAGKGAFVSIAAENTFSVISSIIATLKLGGVFNPVDPHQPAARLRQLAAQVTPAFVLTETTLEDSIEPVLGVAVPTVAVDREDATDGQPRLLPRQTVGVIEDAGPPPSVSGPDDMCYVYFTSGSTGKPKAIAGRLKSIDHFIRWEMETFGVVPGTVVSQLTSPVFDAYLRDAFTPLCAGGTVRVPDRREIILDPRLLCQWVHDARVELIHCVPSLFRTMLGAHLSPDMFPALRYVLLSGEPLLPSDVKQWTDLYGERVRLINLYGPTETTMVKLFYDVKPEDAARRSIPVGQPMPGARALVLDEGGKPAATGAIGEIYIRTPYRTLGYLGEPELTDEVFVPNPLSDDPADIVYRTGDLGRMMDDGQIEFLGRRDHQVKVRGVRVELEEIENAILSTGLTQEAAVVSREDRLGNSYLCAYVVAPDEAVVEQIRQRTAAALPDYIVPSAFISLERLPRTPTGKIDRKSLPAPEEMRQSAAETLAPRNELEAGVALVFAEVLGLERIGVNEDFFKLGGHSLLAMNLLSQLSARFEVELPLAILFDKPTVEGIAQDIEAQRLEEVAATDGGPALMAEVNAVAAAERINEMSDAEVDTLLADILKAD